VEVDQGILVDERMRTSASGIWAAGDVAQARGFFEPSKILNATLPNAVEQGRIAGMDMVDDPALKVYQGAVALNTYKFFGHRAFSVGMIRPGEGCEVEKVVVPEGFKYQKLVFKGINWWEPRGSIPTWTRASCISSSGEKPTWQT